MLDVVVTQMPAYGTIDQLLYKQSARSILISRSRIQKATNLRQHLPPVSELEASPQNAPYSDMHSLSHIVNPLGQTPGLKYESVRKPELEAWVKPDG